MIVKDLIKQFSKEDMDRELIMYSDEEGNTYATNIEVQEESTGKLILCPMDSNCD